MEFQNFVHDLSMDQGETFYAMLSNRIMHICLKGSPILLMFCDIVGARLALPTNVCIE